MPKGCQKMGTKCKTLPEAQRTQGITIKSMTWIIFLTMSNLHQVVLLASVAILATRWCRLHQLKIGPPTGTTFIPSKFGHQVAPLQLVPLQLLVPLLLDTRLHHMHCHIALDWHYQWLGDNLAPRTIWHLRQFGTGAIWHRDEKRTIWHLGQFGTAMKRGQFPI